MKRILIILAVVLYSSSAFAQVSKTVTVDDRVYRAIDRLVAAGVVDKIIYGQRPFSEDEVARIFIEAENNFDKIKRPADKMMVYRLLKYWKEEYRENIEKVESGSPGKWKAHYFDELDIAYAYRRAPSRNVYNNGLGRLDDEILPLFEYMSGRNFANGNNIWFETHHYVEGPYFLAYLHPLFQTQIVSDANEPNNNIYVEDAYIKAGINNFECEIGRDQIAWGQSPVGGLMMAMNTRSMDIIKFSNPHPFRLPWIFSNLGNFKGTIFLSNLGPRRSYKYAYYSAWKLSFQPARFAEVGFNYGFLIGGDGAPKISAGDALRSFFGFIPRVSKEGISDQMGGLDFRFRIPPASGLELYGEFYFQNPDLTHPAVMFRDRAAYLGGIYLPRLGGSHNMGLRFEYRHTSPIMKRSFIQPDGISLGGESLGDAIGPAGDGIYAAYYYDLGVKTMFRARFAYERRGGDFYNVRPSDGGFNLITGRPTEERYRGTIYIDNAVGKNVRAKWYFGYERALNFNFIQNNSKNSYVAGLYLAFDLGL